MKLKIFAAFIILFIFSNCKNLTSDKQEIVILESLKLNNNEKWEVNEETDIGFRKIDSILNDFNETDFDLLGSNLSDQTNYIIKNCIMKGESHDQLHVVLVPILDEISIIKESDNTDSKISSLGKIRYLTKAYFDYFKY